MNPLSHPRYSFLIVHIFTSMIPLSYEVYSIKFWGDESTECE